MSRAMSNEMRRGLALSQAAAARNLAALATARMKPQVGDPDNSAPIREQTQVGDHDETAPQKLVRRPTSRKDAGVRAIEADSAARAAQVQAEAAAKAAKAAADAAVWPADGVDEVGPPPTTPRRRRSQHFPWLQFRDPAEQQMADQGRDDPIAEARNAGASARKSADQAALLAGKAHTQARKALDAVRLSEATKAVLKAESLAHRAGEQAEKAEAAHADAERYRRIARNADFLPDAKAAVISALAQVERARRDMGRELRTNGSRLPDPGAEARDARTRIYLMIEQKALTAARDVLQPPSTKDPDTRTEEKGESSWDDPGSAAEVPQEIRDDPRLAYAAACYLVRWRGVRFSDSRVDELLDRAMLIDVFLQFAKDDPELTTAPDTKGFEAFKTRLAEEQAAREKQKTDAEQPAKEPDSKAASAQGS